MTGISSAHITAFIFDPMRHVPVDTAHPERVSYLEGAK